MAWCDPCADDPLTHDELKELGVTLGPQGGSRDARRLRHAPAHPLFARQLFRGPEIHRHRRAREFPGSLRPSSSILGRDHLRRGQGLRDRHPPKHSRESRQLAQTYRIRRGNNRLEHGQNGAAALSVKVLWRRPARQPYLARRDNLSALQQVLIGWPFRRTDELPMTDAKVQRADHAARRAGAG